MRGRKPKPTAVKELAGNPGHRPFNNAEAKFDIPSRMPQPPTHLGTTAAEYWRREGPSLLKAGLLTTGDMTAFAALCDAYGRWVDATKKIDELGGPVITAQAGNRLPNPYIKERNDAYDAMTKMLKEFGMTPAERSRVHAVQITEDGPAGLDAALNRQLAGQFFGGDRVQVANLEEGGE